MKIIVLNSTNLVQDGNNNKLIYRFPNSVQFKDNYIAVSSVSMYYSWFNISSALNNNKFYYTWYNAGGIISVNGNPYFTVTIPDGLYEISQLNSYLQFCMIANGTYLLDSTTGQNVYYAEFLINPTRYAVQINTFQFPTALPVNFTLPSNWATYVGSFPTQTFNPSLILPASFNNIVGYSANFTTDPNLNNAYVPPAGSQFISKNGSGTLSYISTQAPNIQPNSSIYISVSNINNNYSQPSSIIYAVVPTVLPGELVVERPPQFMWNRLLDGTYNELRMTFLGTDLQPIKINDPSMTILLTIRDPEDAGLTGK
jgi:hypothetical protein